MASSPACTTCPREVWGSPWPRWRSREVSVSASQASTATPNCSQRRRRAWRCARWVSRPRRSSVGPVRRGCPRPSSAGRAEADLDEEDDISEPWWPADENGEVVVAETDGEEEPAGDEEEAAPAVDVQGIEEAYPRWDVRGGAPDVGTVILPERKQRRRFFGSMSDRQARKAGQRE